MAKMSPAWSSRWASRRNHRRWDSFRHQFWCQPQTLLGWLFWQIVRRRYPGLRRSGYHRQTIRVEIQQESWGLSLGRYLFCGTRRLTDSEIEALSRHELGHCLQSLRLGPLYLLVIGIPSLAWATSRRLGFFHHLPYRWFYTEAWADALNESGVAAEEGPASPRVRRLE